MVTVDNRDTRIDDTIECDDRLIEAVVNGEVERVRPHDDAVHCPPPQHIHKVALGILLRLRAADHHFIVQMIERRLQLLREFTKEGVRE